MHNPNKSKLHFVDNLQFDVRGTVNIGPKTIIQFTCGEIKSDKGKDDYIEQLLKRLCVILPLIGFVIKTKFKSINKKIFINVSHSEHGDKLLCTSR
jgi:hypothetical protein